MRKVFAAGCLIAFSLLLTQSTQGQEKSRLDAMVQRLKTATKQDREKVKSDIEKQLNEEYAAYLKAQQKPILELKKKLDKLQADYDAKMVEFKEQESLQKLLVQHRLDTIWLAAQGLRWPGADNSREIPTIKKGTTKSGTTAPVGKPSPKKPATNSNSSMERKKAIPTSKTYKVYLPGMV